MPWRVLGKTGLSAPGQEIEAVIRRVESWFVGAGGWPDRSIDGEFAVIVHARANPLANQSTMTTHTGLVDGRYQATIHCLWENPDPGSARLRCFRKNVAHEAASVYCDVLTQKKPTGWVFYDAPRWFVQGLPEWIGRTLYDPSWEGRPLPADAPKEEAIEGADENGDIVPRNVYEGGAWLIERLVRAHGVSGLHRLLKEAAPTFEAGFVRTFGVSQREFINRL